MTPVFLSPPSSSFSLAEKQEAQKLKLIISPYQDQKATDVTESQQHDPKAVDNPMWHQESNNNQVLLLSSSSSSSHNQPVEINVASHNKLISNCSQRSDHIMVDKINGEDRDDQDHVSKIVTSMNYDNKRSTSVKWMSSKMRLIQKMSNNPQTSAATTLTDQNSDSHNTINCTGTSSTSSTVRVCSDCNTTSTPLWRSGPRGPKSLCNACGIRQRKARRAMAEAAVVTSATATSTTSYKIKEKKHWRGNLNKNINKYSSKILDTTTTSTTSSSHNSKSSDQRNNHNNNNKLCFRNLSFELNHNYNYSAFPGVFPQDVTEAALLLMELSCGFVHS